MKLWRFSSTIIEDRASVNFLTTTTETSQNFSKWSHYSTDQSSLINNIRRRKITNFTHLILSSKWITTNKMFVFFKKSSLTTESNTLIPLIKRVGFIYTFWYSLSLPVQFYNRGSSPFIICKWLDGLTW